MQSQGITTYDFQRLPMPSVEQIFDRIQISILREQDRFQRFEGLEEMEAEHRIECS